jgi:hypothetical protein
VPNADSTADLSRALHTGLTSPPLSSPPSPPLLSVDSDDEGELGSEESLDDAELLGDAVIDPPWRSGAAEPEPETTCAQAAVVKAASSRASPGRIRRAVMDRSSLVVRSQRAPLL